MIKTMQLSLLRGNQAIKWHLWQPIGPIHELTPKCSRFSSLKTRAIELKV